MPILSFCTATQDTIPPIFTTLPEDITVSCDSDIEITFDNWFSTQGGAQADNGEADIFPTLSAAAARDSLERVLLLGCSRTGNFMIGYFATDSCGNRSDSTIIASFLVADTDPPTTTIPANNKEIVCTATAKDSLQNWLDSKGGAFLADNCSDTLLWTSYSWEDTQGNTGFSTFEDSTNIIISRDSCLWSVDVSMFYEDLCGNINVTNATFGIVRDEVPPTFSFVPSDTTYLCAAESYDTIPAIILDSCDGELSPTLSESSNQSGDEFDCSFYTYEILRAWTATDACGNKVDSTQSINIIDNTAPTIIGEASIAVDCDADLSRTSDFVEATDDCSIARLSFQDSVLFNSLCQNQIRRTWKATDICGNSDSLEQLIQLQDFTGPNFVSLPRDTVVACSAANITEAFDSWVTNAAGAVIIDNCNNFRVRSLRPRVFNDTLEITSAETPTISLTDCDTAFGTLSSQQVSIVAYDVCGNITQREALFSIIDPQPPVVSNCPSSFELQINGNQCEAEHLITLPTFTDNCLTQENGEWTINLNQELTISNAAAREILRLEIGTNLIDYVITDCGGNSASCSQTIIVSDTSPPQLTCPPDQTISLDFDNCEAIFQSSDLILIEENCGGINQVEKTEPATGEFLVFNFNSFSDIYQAPDFIITIEDIVLPENLLNPKLTIEYKLELGANSTISIRTESGQILSTISNADCTDQSKQISLSMTDMDQWASDSKISFTLINNVNNGNGTEPCDPASISGFQGSDGSSYLRLKLEYSEAVITQEITDVSSGISDILEGPRLLQPGDYQLRYSSADASGNQADCITNIEITDTISPILNCSDIVYRVDPLLEDFYPILESDLDYSVTDNCGVDSSYFFPRQILCNDLGTAIDYSIFVKDEHDNLSSCTAKIEVIPEPLNPDFLSNLCFADTLKLVSNIPASSPFQIKWSGPNNFSSILLNPQLIGITGSASGTYTLEATSPSGCVFYGAVDIDIEEFDSPEIFTTQNTVCQGEIVLLNTTSFTEIVEYFWYEGLSPNGTLIGKTAGPSYTISPLRGNHFYYVEVKGNNCNSNPSNTLEIEVTLPPIAEITNPFTTICFGDELALNTDVVGNNFIYEWRGPDNYISNGQFPEVIDDVDKINQGTYSLVIKQGACISDTATAQVIVFDNPEKPIIEGEAIFCEGQTAVLSVPNIPNGTRFSWFQDGTFFRSVNSNSLLIPSISADQSGSWTVVAEEGICQSDTSSSFLINVESKLNIGASNDGPHCEGDSVLLTSSFIPGASYSWEDPLGINYDERIVTAAATAGVYSVTITTPSNCSVTTNTTVEVGSRPEITALSNTSLPCMSGDMPVTLVPSIFPPGNYQYEWTGPNNYTSNALQPIINNFDESDNGTYTLLVNQGNCQSFPASTIIEITTTPETAQLSSNTDPCEGDEVLIEITNPISGSNTTWIWSTPTGQQETTGPSLSITNFSSSDNGQYSVLQVKNGCRSLISELINITIQTEPITPLISGTVNYCLGETLSLDVQPAGADFYTWLTPNGTITTDENLLTIAALDESNAGSYSVLLREGNCESQTSTTVQVEIKDLPSSVTFGEEDISTCGSEQNSLELCISETNLTFDLLSIVEVSSQTILQQSMTSCLDLDFLLDAGANHLMLTPIISVNGCSSISTDTIRINISKPLAVGAIITDDQIILCNQDFTTISATNIPDEVSIKWTAEHPETIVFDTDQSTCSVSNLKVGNNEIYLTSTIGDCADFYIDTITVIVLDAIRAEDDSYDLSFQQSITLEPLSNDSYSSGATITITEGPSEGTAVVEGQTLVYTPTSAFVGTENIRYELCYNSCPDFCDQAEIELTIGENVACYVGNVFTPNGDGVNDEIKVPCLDTGRFPQNSMIIFNQWGDEIYSASPYNNDWQGTYNSKTLPAGTYFYILNLGDGSKPIQGFLTLEL